MAFATVSWASIASSENPSTDGSYTVSWTGVLNASSHQLYEDGRAVYDGTGTSWSASGKVAGSYKYTVGYCEFVFDEEICHDSVYAALTVTVSPAPPPTPAPTVSASFGESSVALGEDVTLTWSSTNASACGGSPAIGSTSASGTKTYTPSSAGTFSVKVTCKGAGGSASASASVTVHAPPTVSASFGKNSIALGESVTLTWSSTNATRCGGSPSIGSTSTSGTKDYTPSSAGTFSVTVTCRGAGGSGSATASVTVPPPPVEVDASFGESSITRGESVTLSWSSSHATRCRGSRALGSTSMSGTKDYTPSSAGIFSVTVTCTGDGGSGDDTARVTVVEPRPTVRAWFNASSITLGGSVTLTWSSTNATRCGGSRALGSTAASGSRTYTPTSAGTFSVRVTCRGAGGSGSATASVTVPPPPVEVDASFDESSITLGESVTLSWSSSHATRCGGSRALGSTSTSGSRTYTPTGTGIFSVRVTCTGEGGSDSDSDSVRVRPAAPTLTVPPTDSDGAYGVSWTRVSGAAGYTLQERSGSGSFGDIYTGSGTSRNITGKTDGTHGYRVQACAGTSNCGRWSSTGSVAVSLNSAPAAADDAARTPFRTAVEIAVLANDTDADGDDLTVTAVTTPANGAAAITADDDGDDTLVTYTPRSGHPGTDTFDYTVSDGTDTDTGTVSVTVDLVTVTPNPSTTGSYTLSWDGSPLLADRYRVLESFAGGTPAFSYHLGTSAQYSGKASGDYHYLVEACETPLGQLEECAELGRATATVELPPPAPTLTVPATDPDGAYTANWTAPARATSYKLEEKPAGGSFSNVYAGENRSHEIAGKAPGIHMYRVRACAESDNCGDWSSTEATKVPPGAPTLTVPATDPDGDYTASWTSVAGATGYELQEKVGTGEWSESETLTTTSRNYTDKTDGTHGYRVRACAGTGNCGGWSSTESVEVSINTAPAAGDDAARTPFETLVEIAVLDNDTDADADDLTVTAVTAPANGWARITEDSEGNDTLITYTPRSGYSGADAFDYTVSDGAASDTASVRVTVAALSPEVWAWFGERFVTLGDDVTLTWWSSNTLGCGGEPSIGSTATAGRKAYAPPRVGTFSVTVTCAGAAGRDSAAASVTVKPSAPELTVPAADADGGYAVTWTSSSGATGYELEEKPAGGSFADIYDGTDTSKAITVKADGTYSYRVRACAGSDNCGDWSPTKSVVVSRATQPPTPTNSAPVALDDTAKTPFRTAVEIAVLDNDTDANGDGLTVTAVTTPANGTATITSDDDGNNTLVTYTPNSGNTGADTFDYTVSDGADTDTGTVKVTVNRVTVTPNPSTTGSYTLSWEGTLLADRYQVLESGAPGDPPLSSYHLGTGVAYAGKATGQYHYLVLRCHTPLGQDEICEEYGRATARVILPITPGNLPYRSGVTKGGDAYVNVPIAPVPGVNGLAPRLSIDYSGGRERHRSDQELPADMIGYGWRVGGFSTIRRCVKGTGDSDGISFDSTDGLCLDGEPLTKIKDRKPGSPAKYRTARESFAKVLLMEDPAGDWFEVHLPDGTVREYGSTADSQLWKPAREASGTDPAEPAAAFLWSINKQTDAFGNVMTYKYYEDDTKLARHPRKITYGDAEDATVEFVYKPRHDLDSQRVGSFFLGQPQRLTYIHLRLGGSLVRDYRLAYKTTGTGQVRLNELRTCGYEPSGAYHCLSPLQIGWQDVAGGTWISQLTDPMGASTTFMIATLSASDPHDFALGADDTPFGATSLPANTRALPAKNGDVKPVVTSVTRSDGIGGTRRTSYAYLGRGVESTRNWGFLGFHAIRETDSASGIATYTQYRLDYPHFGRPAQVVRYDGKYVSPASVRRAKTPLSKRAVRYAEKTVSHAGSTVTTTLPHAEETMEWLYEGTSTLGAVQTTETLTLDAGLVDQVVRETRTAHMATGDADGGSDWGAGQSHTLTGIQRTTQRTLSFDNDETDWVLGFVDDIGVKHYRGDGGAADATPDWTETVGRTAIAGTLAPDVVTRFPGHKLQHKTDYGYDARGNRKTASETEGVPAPDAGGQSSDPTEDSARTWEVLGFAAGRFPTSWQNPLDHTERATHHVGLGVPATTTDANGRRTSYAYDGLGREISRTRHWDSVEITRDGVTTTEDVKTTTAYAPCDDGACAAVSATAADCGTRHSVAPVMKVTTAAPDMPDSTAYLDMFGRAIRTSVEGFGGVDRRVDVFHDARGRMVCESEPYHAGETARYTRYAYDIRDRPTGVVRPDGGETGIMYSAASNRVTATVTETVRASDGATTKATRQTKRAHNVLGELVSVTEGAEQTDAARRVETRYAHDGAGRLKTVTTGGQTTTFAYDAAGNRASVTNPNLGATVSAGDGKVSVRFAHNGHGELTERADARGATRYAYDKLGRRTCAADRGGTATWEYDPANGKGLLKRRSYDRDTVLASAAPCAFGGEFAETYAYNADARLATVTTAIVDDANATTTLTRGHAYDDYGRLATTTYPSSVTVTHEYNDRGYPAKLKHGATTLVTVTARTARGQSKAVSYGNGVQTQRAYDALGRLTDIDATRGTAKIQDNAHAWRSDGSLESRAAGAAGSRSKRKESFAYDYLNRLTEAKTHVSDSATASRTLAFGHDLRGNLKTKTDDASADDSVTGYDYPTTTNRLSSAIIGGAKHAFTHDASGHIEAYACADPDDTDEVDPCAGVDDTFIGWNARGLAEKVTVGDSADDATPTARDSFHYGPDGARHFKKSEWSVPSGNATTMKTSRKYYAGAYEKTVTVGGDTVERTRIGDSVVHVRTTPAGMMATATSVFEYAHRDHLGSVESVTDASGSELAVLGYDPHGERRRPDWTARLTKAEIETLLGAHGERVSRGFTRHEHLDRTGLVHMNGRMYDPRLGRFLSPDPIVGNPASSQSWNLYSYVGNNPLSHVDPTGLVRTGPCDALNSGCMHFGGGGGGGSTTRTMTVTTTVTVSGVMSVPYRHALPVWTQVWDPTLDHYVWHVGDEYFWGERSQAYSFSFNVTTTITIPDESVADEPADKSEILGSGSETNVEEKTRASAECIRGKVLLCQAPAEIAGGLVDHYWLKTDKVEAGMGGEVAEPGEQYESPYITDVYVRDHSGQSTSREGAECRPVPGLCVNKVEEQLEIDHPLGRFHPLNNCATFCAEVIRNSKDPKLIYIPEIDIYP